MKTHVRVRRATSKTPGSVVKARVFFQTPRSAHFVIYVVDKGIYGIRDLVARIGIVTHMGPQPPMKVPPPPLFWTCRTH